MHGTGFGQILLEQVVPQLMTLLGLVITAAVVWLKSRTARMIRENVRADGIQKVLLWVNGLVLDAVQEASQTTVKGLKKRLADGDLTREEYESLLSEIKVQMLSRLQAETVGRLLSNGAVLSDVAARQLLSQKVEAAVPLAKAAQVAAKNGGAVNPPQD
jgi:uncharacterized membrane protein